MSDEVKLKIDGQWFPRTGGRTFKPVGVHYGEMRSGTSQADAVFAGRNGFLTGDVTHWKYAPEEPEGDDGSS